MPVIEYEKEFNLSVQMASELIINWLLENHAKIGSNGSNLPNKIQAMHGSMLHMTFKDPLKYKGLEFDLRPINENHDRIRVKLEVSFFGWVTERSKIPIKEAWNNFLFITLWNKLTNYSQSDRGKEICLIIRFIDELAPSYKFKVPISRVVENFHCDERIIRQIIERFKYESIKYVLSKDSIELYPAPKVIVEGCEMDGEKEFDVVDKIEFPLKFSIKNTGKFPVNIFLYIDAVNLPTGRDLPPFSIKPGDISYPQKYISAEVKDNEYSIIIKLCDNDNDRIEIPGSNIEVKINKKTSKKQKLKNIIKAVFYNSMDILLK